MRLLPGRKLMTVGASLARNYLARESIYPFYASFKVTHKCNFRCKFCNVWKEDTPDLTTEEVCKILDDLGESSILVTSFEGGDPLLRDDIDYLLRYARKKPFYLLFTTSERDLKEYPMETYGKYIDFLHVSIDEGHRNLDMLEKLETFNSWGPVLCVQIVVTRRDLDSLEYEVKRCFEAGAKAVIIDSDGGLFYPCRVLADKRVNLLETPLMDYLNSDDAQHSRNVMATWTGNADGSSISLPRHSQLPETYWRP